MPTAYGPPPARTAVGKMPSAYAPPSETSQSAAASLDLQPVDAQETAHPAETNVHPPGLPAVEGETCTDDECQCISLPGWHEHDKRLPPGYECLTPCNLDSLYLKFDSFHACRFRTHIAYEFGARRMELLWKFPQQRADNQLVQDAELENELYKRQLHISTGERLNLAVFQRVREKFSSLRDAKERDKKTPPNACADEEPASTQRQTCGNFPRLAIIAHEESRMQDLELMKQELERERKQQEREACEMGFETSRKKARAEKEQCMGGGRRESASVEEVQEVLQGEEDVCGEERDKASCWPGGAGGGGGGGGEGGSTSRTACSLGAADVMRASRGEEEAARERKCVGVVKERMERENGSERREGRGRACKRRKGQSTAALLLEGERSGERREGAGWEEEEGKGEGDTEHGEEGRECGGGLREARSEDSAATYGGRVAINVSRSARCGSKAA
eukprot:1244306-Rhodomonas_salina.2